MVSTRTLRVNMVSTLRLAVQWENKSSANHQVFCKWKSAGSALGSQRSNMALELDCPETLSGEGGPSAEARSRGRSSAGQSGSQTFREWTTNRAHWGQPSSFEKWNAAVVTAVVCWCSHALLALPRYSVLSTPCLTNFHCTEFFPSPWEPSIVSSVLLTLPHTYPNVL